MPPSVTYSERKAKFPACTWSGSIKWKPAFLSEYVTEGGMIAKRHQSRLCARCQRRVRKAVKRARSLGLIPTDASFDAENTLGFPDDVHKCHVSRTM